MSATNPNEVGRVWLIDVDDYPESGGGVERGAVYSSLDAAVAELKERYGHPYVVEWLPLLPGDGENSDPRLVGHFAQVPNYSTHHTASWSFLDVPVIS